MTDRPDPAASSSPDRAAEPPAPADPSASPAAGGAGAAPSPAPGPAAPAAAAADDPAAVEPPRERLGDVVRRLGPVGILAAVWTVTPGIMGLVLIGVYLGPVSEWLDARGGLGVAIFIGAFMLTAGLGLLPTYAQAVLAGWVFGAAVGIPAALAGFTGAALLGFAITRVVSGERVERLVADHPRAAVVRTALIGRGFLPTLGIVSLVRLPPNSPFSLTNLMLAGTGVPLHTYLAGTVIGMTPRTAIVALLAAGAAATGSADIVEFVREGRNRWLFVGGLIATILVLAVIGQVASRALDRVGRAGAADAARSIR